MDLYLFRHGIAEDRSGDMADADRALTEEGVKRTGQAAAGLARLIEAEVTIATSPKFRARQTAELAAEALGVDAEVWESLGGGDVDAMIRSIADSGASALMVVGHEPDFGELVERLCFGRSMGAVEMKKAGCACVRFSGRAVEGRGMLSWLATPKMLRALGE